MLILSMIILIYVFAEKNHISQGGEKKLRTLNLIGAVLPLFNIALFALSRGDAAKPYYFRRIGAYPHSRRGAEPFAYLPPAQNIRPARNPR